MYQAVNGVIMRNKFLCVINYARSDGNSRLAIKMMAILFMRFSGMEFQSKPNRKVPQRSVERTKVIKSKLEVTHG